LSKSKNFAPRSHGASEKSKSKTKRILGYGRAAGFVGFIGLKRSQEIRFWDM